MSLLAAIRAELYRGSRGRIPLLLLLLPALVAALRMTFALLAARVAGAKDALGSGGADGELVAGTGTGGFPLFADGLRAGGGALTFAVLLLGALALVRDREHGTLAALCAVRTRGAIVLAKGFALAVYVVAAFTLLFGACFAIAASTLGLAGIEIEGIEVMSAAELWHDLVFACAASIPPWIAIAWLALALSACCSTSGAAVSIAIVPLVTFDVAKSAMPRIAEWVFASYAPLLADGSALHRLVDLARGYANVDWLDGELTRSSLLPCWQGALCLLLAVIVTRRRSI
jgi:hypothetical protein